ncbi:MAG: hypothetical protein GX829_03335 [Clostridium sp.]|nr:hypothetical protein [Clostridium sp.]
MAMTESKENIMIRRPMAEDYPLIFKFVKETSPGNRNTFGEHEWNEFNFEDETFESMMETFGKGNIILGFIDEVLSGIVILTQRHQEKYKHVGNLTLSLLNLELMDTIGKELISRMLLACKSKGIIRKVNLQVREHLFHTQEIYKSLGFYEEGTLARDICANGMFFSTILYGRSID